MKAINIHTFLLFAFREDPDWTKETFHRAAEKLGIRPLQAYKWGYHRKLKEAEEEEKAKGAMEKVGLSTDKFFK